MGDEVFELRLKVGSGELDREKAISYEVRCTIVHSQDYLVWNFAYS